MLGGELAQLSVMRPRERTSSAATVTSTHPVEHLALIGVIGTPIALLLDYRLGASVFSRTVAFRHLAEDGGRVVTFRQVFGMTQILWLGLGARAMLGRSTRVGFRSVTAFSLLLMLLALLWVTEWTTSIDGFTVLALGSNLLPIYAMAGILCHPALRRSTLARCVTIFTGVTAVVIVATAANAFVHGTLTKRVGFFMFGSATDAAMVLAALVPLLAVRIRTRLHGVVVAAILLGLFLTQTRGALAGAVAGVLVLAARDPRVRMKIAILGSGALGVFMLFSNRPIPFIHDTSAQYREVYLSAHWNFLLSRPVTGHGFASDVASYFEAAHNTLLGIADAGGIVVLFLWLLAWLRPVQIALARAPRTRGTGVALATLVAVFIAWNTTGGEVLIYVPPTNMLPLLLATALAVQEARPENA